MSYTAAIVGLGKIGMLYDRELPADSHVLSHARALHLHPDFELVGGVDAERQLCDAFVETFHVAAYRDVESLLSEKCPDVIVVATPTPTHCDLVGKILSRHSPLAILCEKPLSYDTASCVALTDACAERKVQLLINYIRRADPGVTEVRSRLADGRIAMPFKAVVWYSKGLLHNGSHFVDLMVFWFGPIRGIRVIDAGRDYGEDDAEPDIRIDFDHGSALVCAAREENFSHYTVEVVASNGRLRYERDGAISWQQAVPHPTLSGYRQLQAMPELIASDMNRYQYRVVEELGKALSRADHHTLCTGRCAVETQRWLERAMNERNRG